MEIYYWVQITPEIIEGLKDNKHYSVKRFNDEVLDNLDGSSIKRNYMLYSVSSILLPAKEITDDEIDFEIDRWSSTYHLITARELMVANDFGKYMAKLMRSKMSSLTVPENNAGIY